MAELGLGARCVDFRADAPESRLRRDNCVLTGLAPIAWTLPALAFGNGPWQTGGIHWVPESAPPVIQDVRGLYKLNILKSDNPHVYSLPLTNLKSLVLSSRALPHPG